MYNAADDHSFYLNNGNAPGGNIEIYRTTVLGAFAGANDNDSISVGYGAITDQINSLAVGASSSAKGNSDIAIGTQATSSHTQAIAIGYQASSHADYTVTLGNASTLSWDPASDGVTALGNSSYRFSDVFTQKASIVGAVDIEASIDIWADGGADNSDKWSVSAADGGDLTMSTFASGSDASVLTLANNGDVTVAGDLIVNSDRRLKRDIQTLSGSLNMIEKLDGRTYFWRPELNRGERKKLGLIAQEVEAVLPELISENKGGIKSVNYQGMVPVLINAVKELSEQSKNQMTEIELLKKQIQLQQALLTKLADAE